MQILSYEAQSLDASEMLEYKVTYANKSHYRSS